MTLAIVLMLPSFIAIIVYDWPSKNHPFRPPGTLEIIDNNRQPTLKNR